MAEFRTRCPHCGTEVLANEECVGRNATCPSCNENFTIENAKEKEEDIAVPPQESFTCFCPNCKQQFNANMEWLGQTTNCPSCGKVFEIQIPASPTRLRLIPKGNKKKSRILKITLICSGSILVLLLCIGFLLAKGFFYEGMNKVGIFLKLRKEDDGYVHFWGLPQFKWTYTVQDFENIMPEVAPFKNIESISLYKAKLMEGGYVILAFDSGKDNQLQQIIIQDQDAIGKIVQQWKASLAETPPDAEQKKSYKEYPEGFYFASKDKYRFTIASSNNKSVIFLHPYSEIGIPSSDFYYKLAHAVAESL